MTGGKENHKRVDLKGRVDSRNTTDSHLQSYFETGVLTLPPKMHFEAFVQAIRRKESEAHGNQEEERKVGKIKWDLLAHLIGVVPTHETNLTWEEQREWPLTKALEREQNEDAAQTLYTYMLVTFLHQPEKLPFSAVHVLSERVKGSGLEGLADSLKEPHSQKSILKEAKGKGRTIAYISAFNDTFPLVPTISQYEAEHQNQR